MRKWTFVPVTIAAMQLAAQAQMLTPAWVEVGDGGLAIARVVVAQGSGCPSIIAGAATLVMAPRVPAPPGFQPVCEALIPRGTKSARMGGQALALPHDDPSRIAVIGDTGCRIKGAEVQNCNTDWPFEQVAKAAAAAQPQLVIHVGDYLYREDRCPAEESKKCEGSPHGDNWETWNADFFKPAAKLLVAAPWALSRGNHEDCTRAWRGWFYYLDSGGWSGAVCNSMPAPVTVKLGGFQLVLFDSSAVKAAVDSAQVKAYAAELRTLDVSNAWLVDHHPFWAVRPGKNGAPPVSETDALQQAWDQASPKGINMVLSGHTHVFELLSYGTQRPLQIVAGDAGTGLDKGVPHQINGADIYGVMVEQSEDEDEFGYTLLNKSANGWTLSLQDPKTKELLNCSIDGGKAKCK